MSEESHPSYIKIWAILVALLVVSVLGPMFEIQIVTLITAFGIACIKAYMVAKHFMHIDLTPRFVPYLIVTCVVFMVLLFAGTAPDVYKEAGENWAKNPSEWQYMPPAFQHSDSGHH
jgi:caa(3)-type oxidase subunit IV